MTATNETRQPKAMIDRLIDEGGFEAQASVLWPDTRRLLGVYGIRPLMVTSLDTHEALAQLESNQLPEATLPLWFKFREYTALENLGTERSPRYKVTFRDVGQLAVNIGCGEFQPIDELMERASLPPFLTLWLKFYRLDRSRNSFGPQHPLPAELFRLARKHNYEAELEAFRRKVPSNGQIDINFLARYTQTLLAEAESQDPRIVSETPFWQNMQERVVKIIEKNDSERGEKN